MLWHRRKQFNHLTELLRELARSPDNLDALKHLQQILLQEILRAEGHIQKAKKYHSEAQSALRHSRLPKADALRLKVHSKRVLRRIVAYQKLLHIWRCFGDGIAFTYLDKHAIKHAYYNIRDAMPKDGAGFISGKSGLAAEIAAIDKLMATGLPSILSDLTNSIRYGDVCILTGGDPFFIEVKSGDRPGKRGRKQFEDIKRLHDFYETDAATDLRGISEVRRVTHEVPEVSYIQQLNLCIEEAHSQGSSVVNPESGLYYVAIYDDRVSIDSLFSRMSMSRAFVFALNAAKSDRAWSPYVPFTLTVTSADRLYDFIRGELYLMVVFDIEQFCSAVKQPGVEVWWDDSDDDYPLKYRHTASGNIGGLSQHFINRIGFGFVSPQWVAESQRRVFDRFKLGEQR